MPTPRTFRLLFLILILLLSPQASPAADRWRLLAVRVSFPQEAPDNPTTSGDGTFDLRETASARLDYRFLYDAPPHDRTFFEDHLSALATFYRTASDGNVEIGFEVWPRGPRDSYRLSRPLVTYGNGRDRQEVAARITELFRDGIAAADSAEGGRLDFSAFRAVVVFHAGVGGETQTGRAFNDVPSAFVTEEDLARHAGGGVRVQGGRATIRSGILLPEAISTDGRGGMNGTLAHFFGSLLGLPGLSNFRDDLPGAGGWSLMDVGANRIVPQETAARLPGFIRDATGLIGFTPALPEAWSRVRLGWVTPVIVTRDTTLNLVAPGIPSTLPQVVKIPITSEEYYLLENRQTRLRPGEVPKIAFSRRDSGGVWLAVDRPDAFIPGSGVLVWHADETVIRQASDGRGVNDDPHRRGLRLEEADGYSDIGNIFVPFDRLDQIEGSVDDPFYVGGKSAAFGPDTNPPSRSNAGYDTGIRIVVKSPPRDTMTVTITFDRTGGGWPVSGLPGPGGNGIRALDLDGDGSKEIVTESPDGRLYAFRANGRPFGADPRGVWVATGDSSAVTPAVGDVDGDGEDDLVTAGQLVSARSARKGLLWSLRLTDPPATPPTIADLGNGPAILMGGVQGDLLALRGRDGSPVADLNGPVAGSSIAGIAVGDLDGDRKPEVVLAVSNGEIYAVQGAQRRRLGSVGRPVNHQPTVADLDGDGRAEVVVVGGPGGVFILKDGVVLPTSLRAGASTPAAVGDVDGDGHPEVLVGGGRGVHILRRNGIAQEGTPFVPPAKDRAETVQAPPVVGDLDGDGGADVLFAAGEYLYAVRGDGAPLPGFPLASFGRLAASPLLEDIDGDGGLDLVALTASGGLVRWDLRRLAAGLKGKQVIWGQAGGGAANRNALQAAAPVPPPPVSEALLPAGRVYCYPNPVAGGGARVRFYLGRAARVEVQVYNAAADLVGSMVAENPLARAENEIVWDTSGYASGLYVCRVEAVTTDGAREVRLVKAAVVR